jgi:hypothetical protein
MTSEEKWYQEGNTEVVKIILDAREKLAQADPSNSLLGFVAPTTNFLAPIEYSEKFREEFVRGGSILEGARAYANRIEGIERGVRNQGLLFS